MELGRVGLGRMGGTMTQRLIEGGHGVVVYDPVPAPVLTLSLLARLRSRQPESFGAKVIAALRNEFGGHAVKKESVP